jgi:adenosylcobinamide-phosphate synthase
MADPAPLVALALDAAVGWPAWLYARVGHPVGLFARIIAACAARWNRVGASPGRRRLYGVLTVLVLVAVAGGAGLLVSVVANRCGGVWRWLLPGLAAWPALAQRSLWQHVDGVARALDAGDLAAARRAVARIVGRDTAALDSGGVARAAIESLAESFCDGIAAPWFWLILGGPAGTWIYKATNTADSLIGHREAPWGPFGWAAARLDDALNWVPARLAGMLLCLLAGGGWGTLWRDHAAHASPNAGWTEAAMAGALSVRLGGPICYDGVLADKPWLGKGGSADRAALHRAMALYRRACAGLWVLTVGFVWLA